MKLFSLYPPARRSRYRAVKARLVLGLLAALASLSLSASAETAGTIVTVAGTGVLAGCGMNCNPGFRDGDPATLFNFTNPMDVAVDADGNLYVADVVLAKVDAEGRLTRLLGGQPRPDDTFIEGVPAGMAWGAYMGLTLNSQEQFYFSDESLQRVRTLAPDGKVYTVAGSAPCDYEGEPCPQGFSGDGGPATKARLAGPRRLAIDALGNLYFSDYFNHRVRKVSPDGIIRTVVGNGKAGVSSDADLEDGRLATQIGGGASVPAIDADGNLILSTQGLIRKVDRNGIITTLAGRNRDMASYGYINKNEGDDVPADEATFDLAAGIAADAAGNVFIADMFHHKIRKLTPGGRVITVAGLGIYPGVEDPLNGGRDAGDGGPALSAYLYQPQSIAIDADGNLYFSEQNGRRVRKVFRVAAPGLIAGRPLPSNGDVTRDGASDVADAVLALERSVEMVTLTPEQEVFADMDGNRTVDVRDVLLILRRAIDLE